MSGFLTFNTTITPTILGVDTNDYAPDGLTQSNVLRLSSSVNISITGLLSTNYGYKTLIIHNIGTKNIILVNSSALSLAGNRFLHSGNITINGDESLIITYDTTISRWRPIGEAL